MNDPKPCPCCGGRLSSINIRKGKHGLYHADAFCLNLIECGISIDAVDVDRSRAEEKLIEHWNRRNYNYCKRCKHRGMWEDEVEYGYNSPCTNCAVRVPNNYEPER